MKQKTKNKTIRTIHIEIIKRTIEIVTKSKIESNVDNIQYIRLVDIERAPNESNNVKHAINSNETHEKPHIETTCTPNNANE